MGVPTVFSGNDDNVIYLAHRSRMGLCGANAMAQGAPRPPMPERDVSDDVEHVSIAPASSAAFPPPKAEC